MSSEVKFSGRLGLQQRVLPSYRVPFFDMLASACEGGMSLFAGQARAVESIASGELQVAEYAPARNVHLLNGPFYFCYQRGLLDWLSEWSPDALIVEANPRYLSTPAAIKWMQERGRPVIGWGLGAPPPTGSSGRHSAQKMGGELAGLPQPLRRFDRLQSARRGRVCCVRYSPREDFCGT